MALGAAVPVASAFSPAAQKTGSAGAGRDGTRYSRFHPSNFLAHHLARIVTAAVYSDAEHVVDGIVGLKQRAHDLARADRRPRRPRGLERLVLPYSTGPRRRVPRDQSECA